MRVECKVKAGYVPASRCAIGALLRASAGLLIRACQIPKRVRASASLVAHSDNKLSLFFAADLASQQELMA